MGKVYISGALTCVPRLAKLRRFYEKIGKLCGENGQEAYVPHLNTDPIRHSGLTPREVFTIDKYHVRTADLVIAYVGMPSLGVGMELAYAEALGIPIVLLHEKHARVSKFSLGIPTVISRIQFRDFDHALTQLGEVLARIRGKHKGMGNRRMSTRQRLKTSSRPYLSIGRSAGRSVDSATRSGDATTASARPRLEQVHSSAGRAANRPRSR